MTDLIEVEERDPNEPVKVTFYCTPPNYDGLVHTSISQGETRQDAINRAIALYNSVMAAEVGQSIRWKDHHGGRHSLMVTR